MSKRHRHQQTELDLQQAPIRLPGWKSLPTSCRDEVIALLAKLLKQHTKPRSGSEV